MTRRTPALAIALASLAIAAPAASAMPDNGPIAPVHVQDLRNPDQQAPAIHRHVVQDLRNADRRGPAGEIGTDNGARGHAVGYVRSMAPESLRSAPVTKADDGTSPWVFVLPTIALLFILGAATVYVRATSPAHRSRVSV